MHMFHLFFRRAERIHGATEVRSDVVYAANLAKINALIARNVRCDTETRWKLLPGATALLDCDSSK